MAGGKGTKDIATRYPVTSGIVAGTTSQTGHQENLVPTDGSLVAKRLKVGINGRC